MNLKTVIHLPSTRYSAITITRWLWQAWRGNHIQATLNAAIGLVDVCLSLSQVWAVKHAIDVASGAVSGSIYMAVGLMGLLIAAGFALNIASIWVRNILGVRAQNRMQQHMLDRLLRSEWHGKERHHSGDVLNRLETDVANVVGFLTETIPNTLSVLALFVGAFFYLFSMDHTLAFITVAIIPVFVAFSKIYMGRMRKLTRSVRDSDSRVQSILQETIQHRMVIKTLESEDEMTARLDHTQATLRRNVVKRTRFSVFSNLALNSGFAFGYLVAFLWAAVRMSAHTLTFGGMTAFLQLVNKIQTPARSLTKLVPAFVSVLTAAERLMELEELPLEQQGDNLRIDSPCGLRLHHVGYTYEDGTRRVIDNLSFDFAPGSATAVLGETGAGKTTLIRLLLALLHPEEGRIDIYDAHGSHAISPLTRCNFVYVPQGNTLMSGTIRDNLRLSKTDASEEEMRDALHRSCADFVFDLNQGLDTVCSEQGGGLSEGQAQRIAIARALLRDRPILLLDEATSALDGDTECRVIRNIMADHSKTIIFITHRPAVLQYCDRQLHLTRIEAEEEEIR